MERCAFNHSVSEGKCPAKGKQCNKCHKNNLFTKVCRIAAGSARKKLKCISGVHVEDRSGDDDFMFIGCVVDKGNEWYETLTICISIRKCNTIYQCL